MAQPIPERRFIARILSMTGPDVGWRPGDRLVALVPVGLTRGGEWQQLDGEFSSYKEAEAAVCQWWEPFVGRFELVGQKIQYEVENACDWESAFSDTMAQDDIYRHLWIEQVVIRGEPVGPRTKARGRFRKFFR